MAFPEIEERKKMGSGSILALVVALSVYQDVELFDEACRLP